MRSLSYVLWFVKVFFRKLCLEISRIVPSFRLYCHWFRNSDTGSITEHPVDATPTNLYIGELVLFTLFIYNFTYLRWLYSGGEIMPCNRKC